MVLKPFKKDNHNLIATILYLIMHVIVTLLTMHRRVNKFYLGFILVELLHLLVFLYRIYKSRNLLVECFIAVVRGF